MNKKIAAIIAGSVAALGSAIIAAPAHAVKQDVDVVVTIQPGMFLRTFKTIDLQVTQGDLSATLKESDYNPVTDTTNGTGKLTVNPAPVIGTGDKTTITKSVDELYAVWSNSGKNVTITVTPVAGADGQTVLTNETEDSEILITKVTSKDKSATIPTSRIPRIGGIDLELDVSGATAGMHTGAKLTVEALAEEL